MIHRNIGKKVCRRIFGGKLQGDWNKIISNLIREAPQKSGSVGGGLRIQTDRIFQWDICS
jgi:hypothetical protein